MERGQEMVRDGQGGDSARRTEAETLTFFRELSRAGDLTDEEVIERCIFLIGHAPPDRYHSLKIKGKFVQLIKRLEMVDRQQYSLSRDDTLQPSGVVWRTGEDIEAAGRDFFPKDAMACTIAKDMFKLWSVLSFMQGIGTLHQVDGRGIELGGKIMDLIEELGKKYPALAQLLDPPTVIFNLQAKRAIGMWTCPSEVRTGELIGHLRATLAPTLLPGIAPQFHYFNAPMQNL